MKPTINLYVLSDNHFNHWNINRLCKRGFNSLEHMNDTMIKRWNRVVKPTDIVVHVGDIIFTKGASEDVAKVISQLNGRKILVVGNHDRKCICKNTRILTENGYKYHYEIETGDIVPTVNLETGKVFMEPVLDKYEYQKEPFLYEAKHRSGEMRLSNHHTVIHQSGLLKRSNKWQKDLCENLASKNHERVIPCYFSSNGQYKVDENKLKLMAWIMTDGYIKDNFQIVLYQSKQKYIKEIKRLLKVLGFVYKEKTRQRKIKEIQGKKLKNFPLESHEFYINPTQSKDFLRSLNFFNKYNFPKFLWELSDKDFEIFINEMVKGDGSLLKNGTRVIWGKKKWLESLMGLCVTHNLSTNLLKQTNTNNYYLCIRANNSHKQFEKKHWKKIRYNDLVWCIHTNNNNFFAELNGKTFVTGNSYNWYLTHGFDFVCDQFAWDYNKKKILFVHNPNHVRMPDLNTYHYVIHGHQHNSTPFIQKKRGCIFVNVSVEHIDYTPLNLITLLNRLKQGYYDDKSEV